MGSVAAVVMACGEEEAAAASDGVAAVDAAMAAAATHEGAAAAQTGAVAEDAAAAAPCARAAAALQRRRTPRQALRQGSLTLCTDTLHGLTLGLFRSIIMYPDCKSYGMQFSRCNNNRAWMRRGFNERGHEHTGQRWGRRNCKRAPQQRQQCQRGQRGSHVVG